MNIIINESASKTFFSKLLKLQKQRIFSETEYQLEFNIDEDYKEEVEKWLDMLPKNLFLKVISIEDQWLASIITLMQKRKTKNDGKTLFFEEIETSNYFEKTREVKKNKNLMELEDYFRFEINEKDEKKNDEFKLISYLRTIKVFDKNDTITFELDKMDIALFREIMNEASDLRFLNQPCKVAEKNNHLIELPYWLNLKKCTLGEFVAAHLERNIFIKFHINKMKMKSVTYDQFKSIFDEKIEEINKLASFVSEEYKDDYNKIKNDLKLESVFEDERLVALKNLEKSKNKDTQEKEYKKTLGDKILTKIDPIDSDLEDYFRNSYHQHTPFEFIVSLVFHNLNKSELQQEFDDIIYTKILQLYSNKNYNDLVQGIYEGKPKKSKKRKSGKNIENKEINERKHSMSDNNLPNLNKNFEFVRKESFNINPTVSLKNEYKMNYIENYEYISHLGKVNSISLNPKESLLDEESKNVFEGEEAKERYDDSSSPEGRGETENNEIENPHEYSEKKKKKRRKDKYKKNIAKVNNPVNKLIRTNSNTESKISEVKIKEINIQSPQKTNNLQNTDKQVVKSNELNTNNLHVNNIYGNSKNEKINTNFQINLTSTSNYDLTNKRTINSRTIDLTTPPQMKLNKMHENDSKDKFINKYNQTAVKSNNKFSTIQQSNQAYVEQRTEAMFFSNGYQNFSRNDVLNFIPIINENFFDQLHNDILSYSSKVNEINQSLNEIKVYLVKFVESKLKLFINLDFSVFVYGSMASGLSIESSDIDLALLLHEKEFNQKNEIQEFLRIISNGFESLQLFDTVKPILEASVPILKLVVDPIRVLEKININLLQEYLEFKQSSLFINYKFDIEEISKIKIDINIINNLSTQKAIFWALTQISFFPQILPLTQVLKRFTQIRSINDPYKGGLSSYSLLITVVFYFTTIQTNTFKNLGEMLYEYFELFGVRFDFRKNGIDLTRQKPMITIPFCYDLSLYILDPNQHNNNVARTSYKIDEIKQTFTSGYEELKKIKECYYNKKVSENMIIDFLLSKY